MHVSGAEVPQQPHTETAAPKKQGSTDDLFATFLQRAGSRAFSNIRLEAGTDLGQQIVADAPQPRTDEFEARTDYRSEPREDEDHRQSAGTETDQVREDDQGDVPAATAVPAAEKVADTDASASVAAATGIAVNASAGNLSQDNDLSKTPSAAAGDSAKANAAAGNRFNGTMQAASFQAPQQGGQDAGSKDTAAGARNSANRLTAQVTETPQQIVSRPSTYLAATNVVAAQADKQRPAGTGASSGNGDTTERAGNLLLNGTANRSASPNATQRAGSQNGTMPSTPTTGDAQSPAPPAPGSTFTTALAANRTAVPAPATGQTLSTFARAAEPLTSTAPGGLNTSSSASTDSVRSAPPPRPPIQPRVLTEQISVQIQKSVGQGEDRIKIQLKPAELGRVEIKLDVMQDGRVSATIIADRPETLELLQRDARGLQQALQDAGLKSDNANLSFNLGGGNASGEEKAAGADDQGDDEASPVAEANAEADTPRRIADDGSIDVKV